MTFEQWYKEHWPQQHFATVTQMSFDQHKAMIAWAAAKDFNPVNLQDLEYICEIAMQHFGNTEEGWRGRAHYYRDKLRELAGTIPG